MTIRAAAMVARGVAPALTDGHCGLTAGRLLAGCFYPATALRAG